MTTRRVLGAALALLAGGCSAGASGGGGDGDPAPSARGQGGPRSLHGEGPDARVRPGSRPARVTLPRTASGPFRVEDVRSGLSIDVRLEGAAESPAEPMDGYVLYRSAGPAAADVLHRVTEEGTEDYLEFEEAPPGEEIVYDIGLGETVAGLRLVANMLEVLDRGGTPRLRMAPPFGVDAAGRWFYPRVTVEGCAHDTDARPPWGRELSAAGAEHCTVRVSWAAEDVRYPALVDPQWVTTGNMAVARSGHTATLLEGVAQCPECVLVVGGHWSQKLAEVYKPDGDGGAWSAAGNMIRERRFHTATALGAGKVLIAGGDDSGSLPSAEIFEPAQLPPWKSTASMKAPRSEHAAALLPNGKVLVVGGYSSASSSYPATAEVFDPTTSAWTDVAGSPQRRRHTATRLGDGRVLVVGGYTSGGSGIAAAALFDPGQGSSGGWTMPAPPGLSTGRRDHAAVLLPGSGRVLVVGGRSAGTAGSALATLALFDPDQSLWTQPAATLAVARHGHTATVLADGRVLIAGGVDGSGNELASTELYDPGGDSVAPAANMLISRSEHTTTALSHGRVLVAGGDTSAAELLLRSAGEPCLDAAECATGFCADGVCCEEACDEACDVCAAALGSPGDGQCGVAPEGVSPSPACGPVYLCDGLVEGCPTGCHSDAGCAGADLYCSSEGQCEPKKPAGAACDPGGTSEGGQCAEAGCDLCESGHCADGFCCESACDGECDACSTALGAPADGTCASILGWEVASCAPFLCGAASDCPTSCKSDDGCVESHHCKDGECVEDLPDGEACAAASQCKSGHCVDGVCCLTACDGQCEACDGSSPGSCEPVEGAPRGDRLACAGSGVCEGECDGEIRTACVYPGPETPCGHACEDGGLTSLACDGAGECAVSVTTAGCGQYACDDAKCKTSCAADADCAAGHVCEAGKCLPGGLVCEGDTLFTADGAPFAGCAPYVCEGYKCKETCTSVADCAAPNVCDGPTGTCVAPDTSGGSDADACTCSAPGAPSGGQEAWLAAIAAVLAALSRQRPRRR